MTISLGNALKAVKEDEYWKKKTLIGGLLFLVYFVGLYIMVATEDMTPKLIGLAILLVFLVFIWGFNIATGNKMINSDSNAMAEWTEKNLMLKGLKFILSWSVYVIAFVLLSTLISTILMFVISIALSLIYLVVYLLIHPDCTISGTIMTVIGSILYVVLVLYIMQFINAATISYIKNTSFKDLMSFKKQFRMITENQHAAWTLIGKEILFGLLLILVCLVLCVTVVGVLALPFVMFMAAVASIHLYVQYGKQIDVGRYLEE